MRCFPKDHCCCQPEGRRWQDHHINRKPQRLACGLRPIGALVDFDPQGNASTGLGIEDRLHNSPDDPEQSEANQAIQKTQVPGLDIIPTVVICRRLRLTTNTPP